MMFGYIIFDVHQIAELKWNWAGRRISKKVNKLMCSRPMTMDRNMGGLYPSVDTNG